MRRQFATVAACVRIAQRYAAGADWRSTLTDECLRLGGVYVKFLQMLATHQYTKHWVASSRIYQTYEDVPFEPIDVRKQLVLSKLSLNTPVTAPASTDRVRDSGLLGSRKRRVTHKDRSRIVELYSTGMSTRKVAQQVGLAKTTVLAVLKREGFPVRPQGGDHRSSPT